MIRNCNKSWFYELFYKTFWTGRKVLQIWPRDRPIFRHVPELLLSCYAAHKKDDKLNMKQYSAI